MTVSNDRAITQKLAAELATVESRFAAELVSDLTCVNHLVGHVERYRGKMLRPTLVLVSGLATLPAGGAGDLTDAHRVVATTVEMVHMASLVHDDILDDAQTRRRGTTVNHLTGNETAVMLGDYLISHAYHLCSAQCTRAVCLAIADVTNTVCEGELLQLANRNNWALDEATYFEIIRRKTASLCGVCCQLGAALSDAPPAVAEAMYEFGERLGIAFQIVDDVLDLTGSESVVGKSTGRDIEKGKLTLPLIHALQNADPANRQRLNAVLHRLAPPAKDATAASGGNGSNGGNGHGHKGNGHHDVNGNGSGAADTGPITVEEMTTVRDVAVASGSVEYANRCAARLVRTAKGSLAALPDTPVRTLLGEMADAILTRKF